MLKSHLAFGAAVVTLLAGAAPVAAQSPDLPKRVAEANRVEAAVSTSAVGSAPVCEASPTLNLRTGHYTSVFPDCSYASEDGHPSLRITDRPDHGNLNVYVDSGFFYYVPDAGFEGSDAVKFVMSNAAGESAEQTVNFEVAPSKNTAPHCYASDGELATPEPDVTVGHLIVRKGATRTASLYCFDPDGDDLTLQVKTAPAAGTLTAGVDSYGSPTATYAPAADAAEASKVSAVVVARDEHGLESNERTIGFEVQAADYNTTPQCDSSPLSSSSWQTIEQGDTVGLWDAWCWDAEGDAVTFVSSNHPDGTTVTGNAFGLSLASTRSSGSGSLTYKGVDAKGGESDLQSISVNFVGPHADPSCGALTLDVAHAARAEGDVACSDADSDPMHVHAGPENHDDVSWAKHGDVEVNAFKDGKLHFVYVPDAGFSGADGFIVSAVDEFDHSSAKVTLNVAAAPGSNPTPGGQTPVVQTPPPVTPEQVKAAMTTLLSNETIEFLNEIGRANRKGINAAKPVLSLGTVGAEQLPNGGTAQFGVFDKPAGKSARAAAKRRSLGSTKVTLAKGQKKAVRIKLNAKGKSLLRKKGKIKLTVDATFTDALTGAQVKKSKTITFKVKKKRRK